MLSHTVSGNLTPTRPDECPFRCNVTAMEHTCALCLNPISGVALQAVVGTFRTRARRGGWWHRDAICPACVDDHRYFVVSADGLREATYPHPDERAEPDTCQACGLQVILRTSKRRKVIVCSDRCRAATYRKSVDVAVTQQCEGCGDEMTGRSDRRYCSPACRQRAYRRRVSA